MGFTTVRRIAARLLGVGENRIRFDPERLNDVGSALTADDVRGYISDGAILAIPVKGVPRTRARQHLARRKKGRGSVGSKKGSAYGRISRKSRWMAQVRAQRQLLGKLREKGQLQDGAFRKIYLMVKGGAFRSRATMLAHLRGAKLLKELKVNKEK